MHVYIHIISLLDCRYLCQAMLVEWAALVHVVVKELLGVEWAKMAQQDPVLEESRVIPSDGGERRMLCHR